MDMPSVCMIGGNKNHIHMVENIFKRWGGLHRISCFPVLKERQKTDYFKICGKFYVGF